MKWLRLWTEILDDPKLCQLTDAEHRRFIHCLAMAAEQEKEGKLKGTIEEIAWRIRTKPQAMKSTIDKLINLNILKNNGNGFEFINWSKRQFRSDNSTERWRKFKSNVGANVGKSLAQTPPDTEQSTEQSKRVRADAHTRISNGSNTVVKPLLVGSFSNVNLSHEELSKLNERFGEGDTKDRVERLSEYLASSGKKYRNHYATILAWARKDGIPDKKIDPWMCRNCGKKSSSLMDGLCPKCKSEA